MIECIIPFYLFEKLLGKIDDELFLDYYEVIEMLFDKIFEYNADEKLLHLNSEIILNKMNHTKKGDMFEK